MSAVAIGSTSIRKLDKPFQSLPYTNSYTDATGIDAAARALMNINNSAAELTVTLNILSSDLSARRQATKISVRDLLVSNNWLKMHGYSMRRNVQTRRAVRLMNYHHCQYCKQGDCDSFECLPGCHYPAFHGGDCADDCEHYKKCESCWYWWNEHKGWKCWFD